MAPFSLWREMKEEDKRVLYCERGICFSNEINGIGCEECIVTLSQKKAEKPQKKKEKK